MTLLASLLIALGGVLLTCAWVGFLRWRDTLLRLHAGSVATVGAMLVLLGGGALMGPAGAGRALVAAFFLVLTTPLSAQAIGRAEFLRKKRR